MNILPMLYLYMSRSYFPFVAIVLFFAFPVMADNPYCPSNNDKDKDIVNITADNLTVDAKGNTKFSGRVQVTQGDSRLSAGNVQYDEQKKILQAKNTVRYTNCGSVSPDWFIVADQVSLSEDQAVAKSAWLVLGNFPAIYFPRYRVLLNKKRKTGLLIPDISTSNSRGLEIGVPYYRNLATNRDMTITPRYFGKRGFQLDAEYRHLSPVGISTLAGDWLDDHHYDDHRYSYQLKHRYENHKDTRLNLRYQRVSDVDYADDIGTSLHFSGENFLRSYINFDYGWQGWQLNLSGEALQIADEDANQETRPYEIRPSVSLAKNFYPLGGLTVGLQSHWTKFDYRGTDKETYIDGKRSDTLLGLSWGYRRPGFHFTPSAKIRYTNYNLSERPIDCGKDNTDSICPRNISRTIPSFSVRSGLVFEKSENNYTRTLEPELFYLNVDNRDQENIPIFDTGRTEFRFAELFSENRFNSVDRIAGADQVTLALTHRVLHQNSGKEVIRASVGKTYYFRKNRVTLPDENDAEIDSRNGNSSDIAGELAFNLNDKVKLHSTLVWNSPKSETSRSVNRIAMNAGNNRLINLYHRYRRNSAEDPAKDNGYEQAGINFRIPLGEHWHLLNAWSYDLRKNEELEILGGLEYQSCCWGLRLLAQRILKDVDGIGTDNEDLDYDTTIGIELNFEGLGSVATYSGDLLENGIFNYKKR